MSDRVEQALKRHLYRLDTIYARALDRLETFRIIEIRSPFVSIVSTILCLPEIKTMPRPRSKSAATAAQALR